MGLIQWLKQRRQPVMLCMHQEDTFRWPAHLGAKTEGECMRCKEPIYFEIQNAKYRKICNRCYENS